MLERLRKEMTSEYPKRTVSWRIIEQNKQEAIYEWVLHKPYMDIPIQHQIARTFLTPSGFYQVFYTRRNTHMGADERAKWIQLLRENSSVVSCEDEGCQQGFSLVDKLQGSVSLGEQFGSWSKINQFTLEAGYSYAWFIPPTQVGSSYTTECLEIATMPNVKEAPLTEFFRIEKKLLRKQMGEKGKLRVFEQSPTEVIYYYSYPTDHLQLHAVVRTFLTEQGYYSIRYKHGRKEDLQKDDVATWVEKVKTITVSAT